MIQGRTNDSIGRAPLMARHKSRQFPQHLRFPDDVHGDCRLLYMAEYIDNGNAFAIPDLWGETSLANLEQDTANPLALGFEPLSVSLPYLHNTANDCCT